MKRKVIASMLVAMSLQNAIPASAATIERATEEQQVTNAQEKTVNHKITLISDENGSITSDGQAGDFYVPNGSHRVLRFSAKPNYQLDTVLVNGQDVSSMIDRNSNTFMLFNITEDCTVKATFKKVDVKLILSSDENGSLSLKGKTGNVFVSHGDIAILKFAANKDYVLDKIFVNDKEASEYMIDRNSNTFLLGKVTSTTRVRATFKRADVRLNLNTDGNGSISFKGKTGSMLVPYGELGMLKFAANENYVLDKIFVNGKEASEDMIDRNSNTFLVGKLTATTNVKATFKKVDRKVNLTSEGNGTISHNGQTGIVLVPHGDNLVLDVKPNVGYELSKLMVNGVDVSDKIKNGQFTVENVTKYTTVKATFVERQNIDPEINVKPEFDFPEDPNLDGAMGVIPEGDKEMPEDPNLDGAMGVVPNSDPKPVVVKPLVKPEAKPQNTIPQTGVASTGLLSGAAALALAGLRKKLKK